MSIIMVKHSNNDSLNPHIKIFEIERETKSVSMVWKMNASGGKSSAVVLQALCLSTCPRVPTSRNLHCSTVFCLFVHYIADIFHRKVI